MDLIDEHLARAKEIIGDRTPGEERYDREVVRWIMKGKDIKKAIAKANEKYPAEALAPTEAMYDGLRSRYEYIAEHERIVRRLSQ